MIYMSLLNKTFSYFNQIAEWSEFLYNHSCDILGSRPQVSCYDLLTHKELSCLSSLVMLRACWLPTCDSSWGPSKCILVLRSRPRKSIHGATPVVTCGATRYINRKLSRRCFNGRLSLSPDFIASLKVLTKRSARPFEDGWYGAVLICFTTFCLRKIQILQTQIVVHYQIQVVGAIHTVKTDDA